ncbi:MAG: hypothetical protein P8Y71_08350 [Pseudolabrys sp.]
MLSLAHDDEVIEALRRIDPISRSAKLFCYGDPDAIALSQMSWHDAAQRDVAIDAVVISDHTNQCYPIEKTCYLTLVSIGLPIGPASACAGAPA